MWVPYDELSEEMKEKDRKEARKVIAEIKMEDLAALIHEINVWQK